MFPDLQIMQFWQQEITNVNIAITNVINNFKKVNIGECYLLLCK